MPALAMFESTAAAVVVAEIPRPTGVARPGRVRGRLEVFYRDPHHAGRGAYDEARALCATCPVRVLCDAEADELPAHLGVWGFRAGLTPVERRQRAARRAR